jgi:hypothetical protein
MGTLGNGIGLVVAMVVVVVVVMVMMMKVRWLIIICNQNQWNDLYGVPSGTTIGNYVMEGVIGEGTYGK